MNTHHSDLGEVGDWGRPISYVKHNYFNDYTNYFWEQAEKPSVVLIDGRFRVCCFLTTLKLLPKEQKLFSMIIQIDLTIIMLKSMFQE